jgi:cell division septation protein DedD
MLRVLSVLLFSGLVTGSVLLANGKYPALDERGLYLAELPASMPDWMVSIGTGVHDKALQWQQEIKALLTAKPATSPPTLPYDAAVVEDLAAWQQQLTTRLNELADSIDTLQLRFEQAQAERAVGSMVLQTGQARQLEALASQLAGLQKQVTGTHREKPRPPVSRNNQPGSRKQSAAKAAAVPPKPAPETVAKRQPPASRPIAQKAPAAGSAADPEPAAATAGSGGWVVNVASSSQHAAIEALQRKLRQQDIQTELQRLDGSGASRYRLRVTGFTSHGEARRYASRLAQKAGIEGAWVSKR